jgi:hypothetical protein
MKMISLVAPFMLLAATAASAAPPDAKASNHFVSQGDLVRGCPSLQGR